MSSNEYGVNNAVKIVSLLIIAIVVVIIFISITNIDKQSKEEQLNQSVDIIEKALVQCYALEGSYPSSIYYLTNYGVIFNEEEYFYDYTIIGFNVMPEFGVYPINNEK